MIANVGSNGEVTGVAGGGGALMPIVGCLKAVVASGAFSPPVGGTGATVSIPLTFTIKT